MCLILPTCITSILLPSGSKNRCDGHAMTKDLKLFFLMFLFLWFLQYSC